jgi:hypothetical protein
MSETKASDIVKRLQELIEKHGDLPVWANDSPGDPEQLYDAEYCVDYREEVIGYFGLPERFYIAP